MKLTGHLTESVFRRYAIVDEADLAEGVAKLAASNFGSRPAETAKPQSQRRPRVDQPNPLND